MWSDWAPPSTAESAWNAVRMTLFMRLRLGERGRRGLAVEAQAHGLGLRRPEALLHEAGVDAPGRAELGDLLEEVGLGHEVEGQARRELVHRHARARHLLHVGDRVGHREGQLLHRGRARLRDVIAADVDRGCSGPGSARVHTIMSRMSRIDGPDREDPLLLGDVLLQDVGLHGAGQPVQVEAARLGQGHVHREQDPRASG